MDIKVKDKVNQRHVGRNLQRIRVYLGMKQEALASDLGVSQQEISKIEKQDEIEDGLLTKIAEVLGISTDVIKDFDVESVCRSGDRQQSPDDRNDGDRGRLCSPDREIRRGTGICKGRGKQRQQQSKSAAGGLAGRAGHLLFRLWQQPHSGAHVPPHL